MTRRIQIQTSNSDETIIEKLKAEARAEILENIEEETIKMREKAKEEIRNMRRDAEKKIREMRKECEKEIDNRKKEEEQKIQQKLESETAKIEQEWKKIKEEKEKNKNEALERQNELNKIVSEFNQKIEFINEQIQTANLKTAEYQMLHEENEELKQKLEKYRVEIELLKEQSLKLNANENIQIEITDIEKSIFDIIKQEHSTKIGQIVLSEELSSKQFVELTKRYKTEQIYNDGVLIEDGDKISIMAIPSEKDESIWEFHSNVPVITRYNLLCVANFVLQLHKIGIKPTKIKHDEGIFIDCILYDEEEGGVNKSYISEIEQPNIYKIQYENNKFENYGFLALSMHKNLKCSKKNEDTKKVERLENIAFTKGVELFGNGEFINEIRKIPEQNER